MEANLARAAKPCRKLRKQLKSFAATPTPDDIHSLRTKTRKVEAHVLALYPQDDRKARKLLRALKPLRKAAGRVRDMDVLLGKTYSLRLKPEQECMIQLAESLAASREKALRGLLAAIGKNGAKARKLLKKHLRRIADREAELRPELLAGAGEELMNWPRLHAENLHAFRKRAKELRSMLRLEAEPDHAAVQALGIVKETAGEWHDWLELNNFAQQALNPETDGALLKEIHASMRENLRTALTAANGVRRKIPSRLAA